MIQLSASTSRNLPASARTLTMVLRTRLPLRQPGSVAVKPRRNSVLRSKTPLKAKKPLTASREPKKQPKPTITRLKKEAIKLFNRAVKYRDSELIEGEWLFVCITCGRWVTFRDREGRFNRSAHAGHFMPVTYSSTRFHEMNVNGQCGICNYNQGEQVKYARALDLKYGRDTARQLEKEAGPKSWSIEELQQIIHDSKEQILFYESQV